jgi:hypothetical protein
MTSILVHQRSATPYMLIRVIEKEAIETFFNRPNLLTKHVYYVKETWVYSQAGE